MHKEREREPLSPEGNDEEEGRITLCQLADKKKKKKSRNAEMQKCRNPINMI